PAPRSTPSPYTTLFRSSRARGGAALANLDASGHIGAGLEGRTRDEDDIEHEIAEHEDARLRHVSGGSIGAAHGWVPLTPRMVARSEERRVGEEGGCGGG